MMGVKWLSAVVAVGLVLAYLAPLVLKLKELSLGIVVVIGILLMLVDLVHSLRNDDA
jgi:hypothetical protein